MGGLLVRSSTRRPDQTRETTGLEIVGASSTEYCLNRSECEVLLADLNVRSGVAGDNHWRHSTPQNLRRMVTFLSFVEDFKPLVPQLPS